MKKKELKVDVWNWVVTKDGKVVQITTNDMPDKLPYEEIERTATVEDMATLISESKCHISDERIREIEKEFRSEFVGYPYENQWNHNTTGRVWVTPDHVIKWMKSIIENFNKTPQDE